MRIILEDSTGAGTSLIISTDAPARKWVLSVSSSPASPELQQSLPQPCGEMIDAGADLEDGVAVLHAHELYGFGL
jgi:hypothetical protein